MGIDRIPGIAHAESSENGSGRRMLRDPAGLWRPLFCHRMPPIPKNGISITGIGSGLDCPQDVDGPLVDITRDERQRGTFTSVRAATPHSEGNTKEPESVPSWGCVCDTWRSGIVCP